MLCTCGSMQVTNALLILVNLLYYCCICVHARIGEKGIQQNHTDGGFEGGGY